MAKFDVVKDYDWCSIPRGSGLRKKAPRVWVKSFKIKSSEALNRFKSYKEIATITDAKSFYDKLYGEVSSPEDDFNFPFFNDTLRSFTNTYGDTFQSGFLNTADQFGKGIADVFGAGASLVGSDNVKSVAKGIAAGDIDAVMSSVKNMGGGGDPGSYIETPKIYQYEQNDSGLEVSFVLSNTINSDYKKNNELVKKLTRINRPKRINSIAMEPPRIYQVKIPGQRFIKWASCSSFGVTMLGTKRELGGVLTPEAYQISMTFTSLTTEVSNFMDDV